MGIAEDILDAIEIIVDKKIKDKTAQIYPGVCKSVRSNGCVMSINGKNNTVQYYGATPIVGGIYRVFVPNGNMSTGFIIVPGTTSTEPVQTGDYNNLINLPSINDVELKGNKTTSDIGIISDRTYIYTQNVASTVWFIPHNMNKYPAVTVKDSEGNIVIGELDYTDVNNVKMTFSTAISGTAYLN